MNTPFIWYIVIFVSALFEAATAGTLVCIWFAVGGLAALLAQIIGCTPLMQWIIFLAVSILAILLIKPTAKNFLIKNPEATNSDKLIGSIQVLTEDITMSKWGKIKINDVEWSVVSENKEEIPKGSKVRVIAISGIKLIVEKI